MRLILITLALLLVLPGAINATAQETDIPTNCIDFVPFTLVGYEAIYGLYQATDWTDTDSILNFYNVILEAVSTIRTADVDDDCVAVQNAFVDVLATRMSFAKAMLEGRRAVDAYFEALEASGYFADG
jgi:hypothetical protein